MNIGFIGFGEVAECISLGLTKFNDLKIIGYDTKYEVACKRAERLSNCKIVSDLADLLACTDYIFVAVPGVFDKSVFEQMKDLFIENKLFMDLSTALPSIKESNARLLEKRKAKYVDVAVLGSISKLLNKTPMIVSGTYSQEMIEIFNKYEFDLKIVDENVGKASTIKLCRSVFMKGLSALAIETIRLSQKYNVEKEVFDSIYKNLDNQSFETFLKRLIDGAERHMARQKDELIECIKIEKDVNSNSEMTASAIKIYETLMGKKDG
ncbi:MAG: NAD(P)-dependent oxidoreductase [Clostridia bacterium]|nr:NAD(P)-dependent oxidoreductase [Clostridia bacterium]